MDASAAGRPPVGAAVDLGSNSVHLLVAVVVGHRLEPVVDESVFLGLGSAVAGRGHLGRAARDLLTDTLVGYAEIARGHGASRVTFLGTEPIRRASDAAAIVDEVSAASGVHLHVVSHEEEAYLTMIGVTEGLPVSQPTLVVDVGGGSTEVCIVGPTSPARAAGIRLGSARLTDRFVTHDPPTPQEVDAMRAAAAIAVRDAPRAVHAEIVAVGGTASNLLKVLAATPADRTLTREHLTEAQAILASQPAAATSEHYLVNPIRARILPAGSAILDAILDHYGADRIRVSEAGLREGAILAAEHAGPAWRDRLAALAQGWRT